MLDTRKNTHHASRHPSLLPLRMALIAAESGAPARSPQVDPNEQKALQLIQKMKTDCQKPSWKDDAIFKSFRLQEVIGSDVG